MQPINSSIEPVVKQIRSRHYDLASAVAAAGPVLTDSVSLAQVVAVDAPYSTENPGYVRPCTEAFVLEDGTIWYVIENRLQVLCRFPAVPSLLPGFFGLAYLVGQSIEFYAFAFPDTPRGRDILFAIQAGFNRPLAYLHNPR